ncbi:haloacid dehalogenase type II [Priestia koreensis]|uniref:haloacid dehalogenase type II n=1 Tax=Priestia koreensis TaxID=284581 RepID=UPI00345A32D5
MSSSIKALIFDVYGTLFDVHSVIEKCEELYPEKGKQISQTWRQKQIEYSFLRQLMGNYTPFSHVTADALRYAVHEHGYELLHNQEQTLMNAYLHLQHYDEVEAVLKEFTNCKRAVFSNGSHDMLDPLIKNAGLTSLFDKIISVDDVKQYKPTPASYLHALNVLGVERHEVLFMSSNGWDISGAKSFGFRTAWINRLHKPTEQLQVPPDAIYSDLRGILEWK